MTRMANVTVLQRHSNDFAGVLMKVPEAETEAFPNALTRYALPLGQAERLEREGLVRIDDVAPDPEELPAEPEAKPAKRKK